MLVARCCLRLAALERGASCVTTARTARTASTWSARPQRHADLPPASSVRWSGGHVSIQRGDLLAAAAKTSQKVHPKPVHTLVSPPDGVWAGLREWRDAPLNRRWVWGKKDAQDADAGREDNPTPNLDTPWATDDACVRMPDTLAECADLVLRTADPAMKAALSHAAYAKFVASDGTMRVGVASPPNRPARPDRPELVHPKDVPSPKTCELGMSAAMIHNVAHIELNAIDLAWDTVARFSALAADRGGDRGDGNLINLPVDFFADFARVADDESRHLGWCLQRLGEMGVRYGDIPAHNVLWEGAESTAGSLPARLAVVPRMQEARGLDAGPRLAAKLQGRGDNRSAAVVSRISEEEIAHVAVGVAWFRHLCGDILGGVDPGDAFRAHVGVHAPDSLRGPFNHEQRVAAGLEPDWYSVGPDHRMGREGEAQLGGDDAKALVGRLRQMLVLEGVDPDEELA